jgi:cytochrome c oxidase assembly factor CtaG
VTGVVLLALLGRLPSLLLGLPLIVLASLVFAATRHEDPAAIRRATLEWIAWLGGVLGLVLAAVAVLAWLA